MKRYIEEYGLIIIVVAFILAMLFFIKGDFAKYSFVSLNNTMTNIHEKIQPDEVKYVEMLTGKELNPKISFYGVSDVEFSQTSAPKGVEVTDFSKNQDKSIVAWNDNGKLVISTQDVTKKIRLNEDSSYLFKGKCNLKTVKFDGNVDGSQIKNASHMFECCENLESVDIGSLNLKAIDYSYMFSQCILLKEIPAEKIDVSNATTLEKMFDRCRTVTKLDVSGWNTSNVRNMASLFDMCKSLEYVDVSGFTTNKVTDMSGMFSGCWELKELDLSNFNTENVKDMSWMFCDMHRMKIIDLSSFDTHKVIAMQKMFYNNFRLSKIYVSSSLWSTVNVKDELHSGDQGIMFYGCKTLVGQNGNGYDANNTSYDMAKINGGYLSTKTNQIFSMMKKI